MAHQKVCKQGRYDIKVKVTIQSPVPTSFVSILKSHVKKLTEDPWVLEAVEGFRVASRQMPVQQQHPKS